jgi:DNA-binding NarL/FixJ family response regulator
MNTANQELIPEKKTVWLVEDNASFRSNVAELIGRSGVMNCDRVFANCEDALSALRSDIPPDVILMDIHLPGLSGLEGTRVAKSIAPNVKVVVLTVFDDNEKIFQAICAGADGYLLKGEMPEKLLSSLGEILEGGAPMNSLIARKVLDLFNSHIVPTSDYQLTAREKEILRHLVNGSPKKQIAAELFLSFHTIDSHLRNIYSKLQVHSRGEAVAKVLKERLL